MALEDDKVRKLCGLEPMTAAESTAYRNEQAMHDAIKKRGRDLGMSQHDIVQVAAEAQRELQRRGMTWQQQ